MAKDKNVKTNNELKELEDERKTDGTAVSDEVKNNGVETETDVNSEKNENTNTEDNGRDGEKPQDKQKVEYYTLAEAYQLMLKGKAFRFAEWDKHKIPFVAVVPRGRTTISLVKSLYDKNERVYRPSQAEAVKKLWYEIN